MIDRKAKTVFGAERRLRVYPHISSRPDRPDRSRIHTITYIEANSPTPLSGDCAPPVRNKNRFHNKKNRPFLTRLADDPIGKEADGETTIGEQNNVTKYIN